MVWRIGEKGEHKSTCAEREKRKQNHMKGIYKKNVSRRECLCGAPSAHQKEQVPAGWVLIPRCANWYWERGHFCQLKISRWVKVQTELEFNLMTDLCTYLGTWNDPVPNQAKEDIPESQDDPHSWPQGCTHCRRLRSLPCVCFPESS